MSKVTIDLNVGQIREAVGQLTERERLRLIEDLEKDTWQDRFRVLLARIDRRVKKHPAVEKKINHICKEARKERYAQSRNRH